MLKWFILVLLHVNLLFSYEESSPINLFQKSDFLLSPLSSSSSFEHIQHTPAEAWLDALHVKPLVMSQDVWIRVMVTNTTAKPMTRVVHSALTVSDAVDFYVTSTKGELLSQTQAGDTRPYSRLAMKSRYPAVLLSFDAYESQILYVKLSSIGRISLVLYESSYETFLAMESYEATIFGIFIGMMVVVFIYYISLFIKSRRAYMLYYGLYVLVVFAYMAGLFHLGHSFVPDALSLFYGQGFRGFLSLSYICLGLFVYTFLPPKQWWMKWGVFLFWGVLFTHSACIFLAYMMAPLFLTILDQISLLIHLPYIIFLFIYSFVLSMKKNLLAHYITIAMGATLIAVIVVGSALLGLWVLPSMVLHSFFMSAIVIDMVCFVMAYQAQEELLEQKLVHAEHIMFEQSKRVAIGTMLGNVTHQWKQPLGQISSLLMSYEAKRFIQEPISQEYTDELVTTLKHIVNHLGETVGSFNAFFTLEKENKAFTLNDAMDSALSFIADKITLNRVRIHQEIPHAYTVTGSRNGMVNVMLILLQNALENFQEKMTADPCITIQCTQEHTKLVLTVSDNGGGISIDSRTIFEPYVSTKQKGSGSGLFIAAWIMKEHFEGTITASNEGRHACFTLSFPQG